MTNLTIKRVGVLSLAKIFGLITLVIGIVIGVIYGLVIIIVGSALLTQAGGDAGPAAALGGVVGGIVAMILIPIMYGALGFVMGAVYALVFNVASGFLGGLELQVEGAAAEAFAAPLPLPPQQWQTNAYEPTSAPHMNEPR
jgi:hypothetical protein